jgi:hypothetical protein
MAQITPRLQDAKHALDAADRVRADGQALVDQGRQLAKQGAETIRAADPQYWTAARLVFDELSQSPLTQAQAAEMLSRSRGYVSKLYSIGKTFRGRDPQAEGLSFDAAYRQAQEVSDYGIGREKFTKLLDAESMSLTQAEIAEQTGLAQSTVSEYLSQMIKEGVVQKGPGRPARYELAPAPAPSPVPDEHPINDDAERRRREGEITDRLARGESVPGGPGACARHGCAHAKVHHNSRNRVHECERCDCPGFLKALPGREPQPDDGESRRKLDAQEILHFVSGRVFREIKSGRLVLDPAERDQLIADLSGTIAVLREQSQITVLPPDQAPDAQAVAEALQGLARQLRWASTSGQHMYLSDGATVWVVIASTRAAIIRERKGKITAHPSDVTANWLLHKITR